MAAVVTILSYTNEPLRTIYTASRQCHYHVSVMEPIFKVPEKEVMARLVDKCIDMGHTSVLEHASITFSVSGVSRALTHQLVRHRIASYSQQSQRYTRVDTHAYWYVTPDKVKLMPDTEDEYRKLMEHIDRVYHYLMEKGIPPEDARFVLPNACTSSLVFTMNCRELLKFFEERLSKDAQWEIRNMAKLMLSQCMIVLPEVFKRVKVED